MRLLSIAVLTAVLAFAADIYKGKWSSDNSGGNGEIQITLKPEPVVTFTLNGTEYKTIIASSSVEGENVNVAYDFTLSGYKLRSTLQGKVRDGKLTGKYRTKAIDEGSEVDNGTFEAFTQ